MTQAENTDFDFRTALRSPWLYARLLLVAAAALLGFSAPPPSNPEADYGFWLTTYAVLDLVCLLAPIATAYWLVRSKGDAEPVWEMPSWTSNPLSSKGPHHILHTVSKILYAAGAGAVLWAYQFDFRGFIRKSCRKS